MYKLFITTYRLMGFVLQPFLWAFLKRRCYENKEIANRLSERFGYPTCDRPNNSATKDALDRALDGPLVWLHAASVGESLSALPLIDHIRQHYPDFVLLMTSGTVTSAKLLTKRLPEGVIHQFLPTDCHMYVQRFQNYWKPSLVLWFESELWPMHLAAIRQRAIPAVLVNARFSDKTFAAWRRFKWLAQGILGTFTLCLASTKEVEHKLKALGAKNVHCTGNLKYASRPLPVQTTELESLKNLLPLDRPTWVAASTHSGEEEIMAKVHEALKSTLPKVLTIIIPRHPERGKSIAEDIEKIGLNVARRSQGQIPDATTDIYLADTLGELGLFFRLVPIVVIGGSFVPVGGHNPLEPAYFNAAIAWGPYMFNFDEIETSFLQQEAAVKVHNDKDLAMVLSTWFQNPENAHAQGRRAKKALEGHEIVLQKTLSLLDPLLSQLAGSKLPPSASAPQVPKSRPQP